MTTTQTVELPPKTRGIPVWLAILLILLCAGGGGYLAYKFLLGGSNEKIVLLERSPDESIRQAGWRPNVWMVPSGNAQLMIDVNNPARPRMTYLIFRKDLTHEQNVLLSLGRRDVSDELRLTDEQRIRIRGLANAGHVEPPRPVMDAMRDQFQVWLKTPPGKAKEDAETKLLTMLGDATKSIDIKSRDAQTAQADKIRALLTPDQLKQVPAIRLPWGG